MDRSNPDLIEEILFYVNQVLWIDDHAGWWETPLPLLDGLTPQQLLDDDRGEELLKYVETYIDMDFS